MVLLRRRARTMRYRPAWLCSCAAQHAILPELSRVQGFGQGRGQGSTRLCSAAGAAEGGAAEAVDGRVLFPFAPRTMPFFLSSVEFKDWDKFVGEDE